MNYFRQTNVILRILNNLSYTSISSLIDNFLILAMLSNHSIFFFHNKYFVEIKKVRVKYIDNWYERVWEGSRYHALMKQPSIKLEHVFSRRAVCYHWVLNLFNLILVNLVSLWHFVYWTNVCLDFAQGPCCTTDCKLRFGDKCRDDNGCRDASFCDGRAPHCPSSINKPNKTICNKELVCFMGVSVFFN